MENNDIFQNVYYIKVILIGESIYCVGENCTAITETGIPNEYRVTTPDSFAIVRSNNVILEYELIAPTLKDTKENTEFISLFPAKVHH